MNINHFFLSERPYFLCLLLCHNVFSSSCPVLTQIYNKMILAHLPFLSCTFTQARSLCVGALCPHLLGLLVEREWKCVWSHRFIYSVGWRFPDAYHSTTNSVGAKVYLWDRCIALAPGKCCELGCRSALQESWPGSRLPLIYFAESHWYPGVLLRARSGISSWRTQFGHPNILLALQTQFVAHTSFQGCGSRAQQQCNQSPFPLCVCPSLWSSLSQRIWKTKICLKTKLSNLVMFLLSNGTEPSLNSSTLRFANQISF